MIKNILHGEWNLFLKEKIKYDLIYLDPPFFTQKRHKMKEKEKSIYFDDIWNSQEEYLIWLSNVIKKCWSSLKESGVLYSHNNFLINALVLSLLDKNIKNNFITNITWQRSHPHNNIKNNWGNIADSILMFSKTKNYYFNVLYDSLDEKYKNNSFNNKDEKGRYCLTPITGEKSRIGYQFKYKNYNPEYGWRKPKKEVIQLFKENLIHCGKNRPYKKLYLQESKGKPIQNVWNDINNITRTEKNKRVYPTQKPLKLLERILLSSCPKNGNVLDPFAGSGTTLLASIITNKPSRVTLVDKNKDAITLMKNIAEQKLKLVG